MSYTEFVKGDKEFIAALDKASKNTFIEVHNEAVSLAHVVRKNMITGMRSTLKNKMKKQVRRYSTDSEGKRHGIKKGKGAKFHYPSFPGNYPAIDSGELVGSLVVDVRDVAIEVGSVGVPHAEYTNEGTRKMKARPWLKPSHQYVPIEARLKEAFKRGSRL